MSGGADLEYEVGSTPGHEYAGEVVRVGGGVKSFKVGDHAAAFPAGCGICSSCTGGQPFWCLNDEDRDSPGGFAEYAALPQHHLVAIPKSLTWEDGALVEPLAVGLHGVREAELRPGARVLVVGAGPIGLSATFWARRLGAGPLMVLANSPRRKSLAFELGATAFLGAPQVAIDEIHEALQGPPDVVIEAAGSRGSLAQAIEYAKPRSSVIGLGFCSYEDRIVPSRAVLKALRLQFALGYGRSEFAEVIETLAQRGETPRRMITTTVSLTELPAVLSGLQTEKARCKVMVDLTLP
jgi:threonine dehydrogenase-like Zn-dependent dehydrogenase